MPSNVWSGTQRMVGLLLEQDGSTHCNGVRLAPGVTAHSILGFGQHEDALSAVAE